MIFIFLCIFCSVLVSVMLKLAKRYHIDVYQAVTWNYSAAILLTWFFFKPHISISTLQGTPLYIYAALGILLPILFLVIAASVRLAGIVRTDAAQRLSLFIPVLSAFIIFNEKSDTIKIISICIGFIAILCLIPWSQKRTVRRKASNPWYHLVLIFLGMGVIDVLLKQVAKFTVVPFTTSLFIIFIIAFVVAFIGLIYQVATKKMRFSWPHILIGWILGAANFGNIFFYIKAHQSLAKKPSAVFSVIDIGIIIFGALAGLLLFKEKLSRLNFAGIILGVVAILIITYSEHIQKLLHL